MMHWTKLSMFSAADRNRKPDAEERVAALREWRERGSILEWCFGRTGGEHEREDDQSTWGPASVDDVDWSGFPGTITDEQIHALSTEAAEAGDIAQVAICDRALSGDETARAECSRVIAAAEAQKDE